MNIAESTGETNKCTINTILSIIVLHVFQSIPYTQVRSIFHLKESFRPSLEFVVHRERSLLPMKGSNL